VIAREVTKVDSSYMLKAELPGWQIEYGVRQSRSKGDITFFHLSSWKDKVDINCDGNVWVEQNFGEGPGDCFGHIELGISTRYVE